MKLDTSAGNLSRNRTRFQRDHVAAAAGHLAEVIHQQGLERVPLPWLGLYLANQSIHGTVCSTRGQPTARHSEAYATATQAQHVRG